MNKEILDRVMLDPRYLKNIEYGKPRLAHPEGSVKRHLVELEQNLEKLSARGITEPERLKLKFLIHVHDTFKAEAIPDSPILNPRSHASLARAFAAEFTDDEDLLNMVQFHDANYALWKQLQEKGFYDTKFFESLLKTIKDWDLFLMFMIIDGSTKGKTADKLFWFIGEVRKHKQTKIDETWIQSAENIIS